MDRATCKLQLVRKAGILGIGLDCGDGHDRITRGDDFTLIGGSQETHDLLQAKVARFHEELALRGKTLFDVTEAELDEIAQQLD